MTERSDDQLLEAFRRRLAGVEAEVRDLPSVERPGLDGQRHVSRPRPTRRLLAVVAVVALVPAVLVGAFMVGAPGPAGIGAAPGPAASAAPSPTAAGTPATSGPTVRIEDVANAEQAALEKLTAGGGGSCILFTSRTRMAPDLVAADAEIGHDPRPRWVQDGRLWFGDLESALAAFDATFAAREGMQLWIITGEGPTAIARHIGTYVTPNGHEVREGGNSAAPVPCPSEQP